MLIKRPLSFVNSRILSFTFSEEQIVDCDKVEAANFGAQYGGCNGGSYVYVWQYLSTAGGSEPTSVYGAYTAGTTGKVRFCLVY